MKNKKRQTIWRTILFSAIALCGCVGLGHAHHPQGHLCVMDVSTKTAHCSSIDAPRERPTTIGFDDMDDYVSFSPETWVSIEERLREGKTKD